MKLAIAWFLLVALCIVISCSVDHRSGDYVCTKQADCTSPRVCEQGFCIVPDGVPIDAPPGPPVDGRMPMIDSKVSVPDAAMCPAQCTSCDVANLQCKIECGAANNNCANEVVCPPGYGCTIDCNTAGACKNGVVCTDAAACLIECGGANSCKNVQCGDGACSVQCTGASSCHGVDCSNSCGCDVACTGPSGTGGATCQNVICTALQCSTGLGCTSAPSLGCDTCP